MHIYLTVDNLNMGRIIMKKRFNVHNECHSTVALTMIHEYPEMDLEIPWVSMLCWAQNEDQNPTFIALIEIDQEMFLKKQRD